MRWNLAAVIGGGRAGFDEGLDQLQPARLAIGSPTGSWCLTTHSTAKIPSGAARRCTRS